MSSDAGLFQVNGLVAVITGAGSGLGKMMAHALASNGASKVYIVGRRLEKLQDTASGFENIVPVRGDVNDKESLKALADRVKSEVGFINLLVVNSGYAGNLEGAPLNPTLSQLQEHLWSYPQEEMNKVFAVNNTGAFFTMVAFLELLEAGNKQTSLSGVQSQVIFTASLAGFARALSTNAAYSTSKAGTVHQVKMFSTLLAKHEIRVNGIAPGIYPSKFRFVPSNTAEC